MIRDCLLIVRMHTHARCRRGVMEVLATIGILRKSISWVPEFTTIGIRALASKVTTTTTRFEVEKLDGSRFLLLKKRVTS